MATVPELKAQAKGMGLSGYSKMTKPQLEKLIADNTPDLSVPTWTRAEKAYMAGMRGKSAQPMSAVGRLMAYADQRNLVHEGRSTLECRPLLTPRQSRRMRKAENRADARVARAEAAL